MAVTLDQQLGTGNSTASFTTTVTTTQVVAAGATIILVCGRFDPGGGAMSCAGGSLTWVQDDTGSSGSLRLSVFRAYAPAGLASSTVITVTHANSSTDCILGATSFLGVDSTPIIDATGGGTSATTAWSSGSVAAVAGDLLIGGTFGDGANHGLSTPTAPTVEAWDLDVGGQTEDGNADYKLSVAGTDSIDGSYALALSSITRAVAYRASSGQPAVMTRSLPVLIGP